MFTKGKFFTLFKPVFDYLEGSELYKAPMVWLYTIIAAINVLIPLIYLYFILFKMQIFDAPFRIAIVVLFLWIILAFAGWISFQLWWDRRSKVLHDRPDSEEFVATHVFSHFVKTYGEWVGIWIAIVGFGLGLFATIALSPSDIREISYDLGMTFFNPGPSSMILMPLLGFIIILVSRFLSELIKALASIAVNTRKE